MLGLFKLNLDKLDIEDKGDFLDLIDKNNYQYNFVKIAKHYNIAKGDGNNFYPDKFVSYDEAFALIERAVKVANSNVTVLVNKDEKDEDVIKLRDWYKEEFTKEGDFRNFLIEMLERKLDDDDELILNKPATRGDIASMLYYVLTGNKDFDSEEDDDVNEIKDIKLYWDDFRGRFSNIEMYVFRTAFEEIEDAYEDYVEYLIFEDMDEDEGKLYYKKTEVGNDKYYLDNGDKKEIADLTFVAGEENISHINYTAYIYNKETKKIDDYDGKIIISAANEELSNIRVKISKEKTFDFDELNFKDFIDKIKFNPGKKSNVTLEINGEELKDIYDLDDRNKDIDNITFIPADGFTGTVYINYTAYDEEMSYKGLIQVRVTED